MDLVLFGSGLQTTPDVDYIDSNTAYLTALATSHAWPTAYYDKRALSPALRDQLIKQIEADQAGSALATMPTSAD